MPAAEKKRPNWILRGGIFISLGIHILFFLHVAGVYENRAMSYIELSMHQVSKPNFRVIPKPRMREKIPEVSKAKMIQVKQFHVPRIKIDAVEDHQMDPDYERISLPDMPDNMNVAGFSVPGLKIQTQVPDGQAFEEHVEFTTAKEYFEMMNLRIYSVKKYPESAKSRHLEGRVKVQFVLSADGTLSDIKIFKSSHHQSLDEAAIEAIKKASPFPRPPAFIFKAPIKLKISILFELA